MARTKAELAESVLRQMAVLDAAETSPDSDDEALVIAAYEEKYAEISGHGMELTYWSRDSIPDAVFLIMRDLIMNEVQGAFGQPLAPADKMTQEAMLLTRLRRHVGRQASGNPTAAEFF